MLQSLSIVLNFVMERHAADNALSDSMDIDRTVFKASMRKGILFVFSPFTSIFSSADTITQFRSWHMQMISHLHTQAECSQEIHTTIPT